MNRNVLRTGAVLLIGILLCTECRKEQQSQLDSPSSDSSDTGGILPETPGDTFPFPPPLETEDLAFPGADGFGRYTHGGRGGIVYYVTTLDDDNSPGSLRYGLERLSGPRNILFKVSGQIRLTLQQESANIIIRNPYVTVAGQTAPGDGVVITHGCVLIYTHDVIIRHLRCRPGDDPDGTPPSGRDALSIAGQNIIIDHFTGSWALDENVGIMTTTQYLTIQNSLFAECLYNSIHPDGPHSRGMLFQEGVNHISILTNLFAHNHMRNPLITGNDFSIDVVNNLVYNWGGIDGYGTHFSDSEGKGRCGDINVYKNYYKAGGNSNEDPLFRRGNFQLIPDASSIYMDSNWVSYTQGAGWAKELSPYYDELLAGRPYLINQWERAVEVTNVLEVDEIEAYVLAHAGCRVPVLDGTDLRILDDVVHGTGSLINSPSEVGGYETYSAGTAATDTDQDGIPDAWETQHGLNPNQAGDGNDTVLYYTNLECYLNELATSYQNR